MKIGMITDSLGGLSFDELLDTSAELGIERLEFAGGNWSSAPHLALDRMHDSIAARQEFIARLRDRGISISALNCSGNPLHPGETGSRHREVTRKTIALAGLLGIERVVMMSGCPGGPGDANANWVTTSWPPETQTILRYQWEEVLIPYWRDLAAYARGCGVTRLCLELHGHQNVYSVGTFFRLREAVGDTVGVNFDPSHLMWMGADPLAAIAALDSAIYHVRAKDTRLEPQALARGGPGAKTSRTARGTTSPWVTVRRRRGGAGSARRLARSVMTTCCRSSTRILPCRRSRASRNRSHCCAE
jgi:sugar phosphate isomerase/epimerase